MLRSDRMLVIVGGGPVDLEVLKQLHGQGFCIVAADGGAQWCARARIVPEAIIGDMDSLKNRKDWETRARVIEIPEQETTDFEKCLYSTDSPMVLGLGMTGGRLDHTLSALSAIVRYGGKRQIILLDSMDVIIAVRGDFSLTVKKSGKVSIHPVAPIRFTNSQGLAYPLKGVELAPGKRTGISNEIVKGGFAIVPDEENKTTPYLLIMAKENVKKLLEKY